MQNKQNTWLIGGLKFNSTFNTI